MNKELGLTPDSLVPLAIEFTRSAALARECASQIRFAADAVRWAGQDADRLLSRAQCCPDSLQSLAVALQLGGEALLAQVVDQEAASADHSRSSAPGASPAPTTSPTPTPSPASGNKPAPPNTADLERNARTAFNALFADLTRRGENLNNSLNSLLSAEGNLTGLPIATVEGRPPSEEKAIASSILLLGALASAGFTLETAGEVNPGLLAERRGTAGGAQPVGSKTAAGQAPLTRPTSVSSVIQSVADAQSTGSAAGTGGSDIRITKVAKNGHESYIVSIPGTTSWSPVAGSNPMDTSGNAATAAGQPSAGMDAVTQAMQAEGIPPDAHVLLVGHSQGGMVAAALTQNPEFMRRFHVTNVVTAASPIDGAYLPDSVNYLQLAHQSDPVPKLDLGGEGSTADVGNVTKVTLADPPLTSQQASTGALVSSAAAGLTAVPATAVGMLNPDRAAGAQFAANSVNGAGRIGGDFSNALSYHKAENYVASTAPGAPTQPGAPSDAAVKAQLQRYSRANLQDFMADGGTQVSANDYRITRAR